MGRLARHVQFVALLLGRDGARANNTVVRMWRDDLPSNVLILDSVCDVHRLHLVVAATLASQRVISDLFCLSHLLRMSDFWLQLMAGVAETVIRNLCVDRKPPDPEHQRFARMMAETTLLRHTLYTRARCQAFSTHGDPRDPGKAGMPPASLQRPAHKRRTEVVENILAMANGNWMLDTPVHHCQGPSCCRSLADSQRKFLQATFDYIMAAVAPIPALNRWHTISANLSWWAAGFGMHRLICQGLQRMACKELGKLEQADQTDPQDPSDPMDQDVGIEGPAPDFHVIMTKRIRAGARFVSVIMEQHLAPTARSTNADWRGATPYPTRGISVELVGWELVMSGRLAPSTKKLLCMCSDRRTIQAGWLGGTANIYIQGATGSHVGSQVNEPFTALEEWWQAASDYRDARAHTAAPPTRTATSTRCTLARCHPSPHQRDSPCPRTPSCMEHDSLKLHVL